MNALDVHPKYCSYMIMFKTSKSCLVTGGSDGCVAFWDYRLRRRISQFDDFPTSISSLAFNADGTQLAIASSYLYENGRVEFVCVH